MRGKKNSARFEQAKRQIIIAIMHDHNHKENPVTRETQIIVITRAFRVLERIWKSCGPEEVWNCLRSQEKATPPRMMEFFKKKGKLSA